MDTGGGSDSSTTGLSGTSAVTVSGSGPADSSTGDTGGAEAPGESTAPGTDDGTDGATDGSDTTEGGISACNPPPTHFGFDLALDWDGEPGLGDPVELDVDCTVAAVASPGGVHSIELDCQDGPHTVDVYDLGPLDLAVGEAVHLRAHDYRPWWGQTHILLQRDAEVIVAGMVSGQMPAGPGDEFLPPATFFEPLGVELLTDVCEPEPHPDDNPEPCNFLCDAPCTQDQRQAMRFTLDGRSTDIYDANLGSLAGLEIAVPSARHHVEVFCADMPGAWYQFVATRTR